MRWSGQSIKAYVEAREYIDTALIPLVPFDLLEESEDVVAKGEYVQLLADGIEKQFTGRMMLLPPYTYLQNEPVSESGLKLNDWEAHLKQAGFQHIIYLTCDASWREKNTGDGVEIVWVPSISLTSMEPKQMKNVVQQQINQTVPLITKKWSHQS